MADDLAVIIGFGLATPLGLGVAQTAANLRAGLSAARGLPSVDERYRRVVGCRIPPAYVRVEPVAGVPYRLLELAALAAPAVAEARAGMAGELPTHVCVPDGIDGARLIARLPGLAHAGTHHGRAGGVAALPAAADTGFALVLAVDSLLHPLTLSALQRQRRLRTEDESDGLVPGQAAAAVLVASPAEAARRGLRVRARLQGIGTARDPGTPTNDEPCTGDGLSAAVQGALGGGGAPVAAWWTTLTGERFFAPELAATQVRNAGLLSASELFHAAEGLGDTGAASGIVALVLASAGRERPALIASSSDDGLRAAALLG